MERETYLLIRSAGPRQGTFVGLMWILSFICIANCLTSPILSLLGLGIGIGSLLSAIVLGYQLRWRVCKGQLSFAGQWLAALQMFLYASVLMAMGVYLYMRFIDGGTFSAMYQQMLQIPENKALLDAMLADSGQTSEEAIAQFTAATPISLALNVMSTDMMMGLFISLPTALLSRIKIGNKIEKLI